MYKRTFIIYLLVAAVTIVVAAGCATKKNTAASRSWKAFTARYNTYFNGHQAYINGYKTKVDGNKDNYTDYLPLLLVGNKNSQSLGKGDFETTVTKMEKTIQLHSIKRKPERKRGRKMSMKEKQFRAREEFNPFLKNAWMLMGYAQMQTGNFIEAASTFSYTENLYRTQPEVRDRARAMLALCYTELEWYYDAEELLRKVRRDSIPRAARDEYNTAMADLQLRQKQWSEAVPYLKKVIPTLHSGVEKARGYFLLGQIYNALGQKQDAYKAFQKSMRKTSNRELRLNALVNQTEVMPRGENTKKIRKLTSLTRQSGNKDFLDQIYYAIGNVYLSAPDTAKALEAYQTGAAKAETKGPAYASLMMQMGDIYWAKERFSKARDCYSSALSIIQKENDRYDELSTRTKVLDKLAAPSEVIFVQDSMRALARMPEAERLAVIDKAIEVEKKRQKELRARQADSIANSRSQAGNTNRTDNNDARKDKASSNTANANDGAEWYFYNQQSVSMGKDMFTRQWGTRKNEDNWRRSNKSVLAITDETPADSLPSDSLSGNGDKEFAADSLQNDTTSSRKNKSKKSADEEKLTREYYLAQLPLTPEKWAETDSLLKPALFQAGVIEKDYLENYALAKRTLLRLLDNYPDFQPMDELLYHLYLLELHWGQQSDYESYRSRLTADYPQSPYTTLINDPYFEENARFGRHIEDSLYVATYEAYKKGDYSTIRQNCAISQQRFPKGENRAKFMFFDGMSRLRDHDLKGFVDSMRTLVKQYPEDKISEIAGMMVKGIEEGRQPANGTYDIDALLLQRTDQTGSETDQILNQDTLSPQKQTDFTFILEYNPDSVDVGKLVYEVSRFNFTTFMVRNFEIELYDERTHHQLRIKGFYSFDEAHTYEQKLMQDSALVSLNKGMEPILISDNNLQLIGVKYTWAQYQEYYQKTFGPAPVKKELQLDQRPDQFIWDEYEDEGKDDDQDNKSNPDDDDVPLEDDDSEWY